MSLSEARMLMSIIMAKRKRVESVVSLIILQRTAFAIEDLKTHLKEQQSTAAEPNKKAEEKSMDTDVPEPPRPNVPSPEDSGRPNMCQEILQNLEPFANVSLANVTVEDCQVPTEETE